MTYEGYTELHSEKNEREIKQLCCINM